MRDRFSVLAFLTYLAHWLVRVWQKQSGARKAAWICLVLSLGLVLALPVARLVLDLNPYRPAARQVQALLAAQPDFEVRLRGLSAYRASLLDQIQPAAAQDFIQWNVAFTVRARSEMSSDTARLAQQFDLIAHAVLRLQRALTGLTGESRLAQAVAEVHSEDISRQMTALQHIHAASPLLLREIHEIRRANQALAVQLAALEQDASLQAALAGLQANPSETDKQTLVLAAVQWSPVDRLCQSTEIQLANTVSILNQMSQIIQPVYRQDQIWGFSTWIHVAAWIEQRATGLISLAAVLALSGILFLFWKPVLPRFDRRVIAARLECVRIPPLGVATTPEKNATAAFAQQSEWLVKGLARRMPSMRLNLSRRGAIRRPRLLIPVTDGKPVEKPLPDEGITRIGNDPAFTVKIPFSGSEYIEFWIQKAHRGYFIEVMFSDVPVLHNQHPLSSTRALNHGDQIQIQDTTLVFLEH